LIRTNVDGFVEEAEDAERVVLDGIPQVEDALGKETHQ
jgi:hypothetical protein